MKALISIRALEQTQHITMLGSKNSLLMANDYLASYHTKPSLRNSKRLNPKEFYDTKDP